MKRFRARIWFADEDRMPSLLAENFDRLSQASAWSEETFKAEQDAGESVVFWEVVDAWVKTLECVAEGGTVDFEWAGPPLDTAE